MILHIWIFAWVKEIQLNFKDVSRSGASQHRLGGASEGHAGLPLWCHTYLLQWNILLAIGRSLFIILKWHRAVVCYIARNLPPRNVFLELAWIRESILESTGDMSFPQFPHGAATGCFFTSLADSKFDWKIFTMSIPIAFPHLSK